MGYGDKLQSRMSPYNWASKLLLSEWITGEYPNLQMNFSLMKFSLGSLLILQNVQTTQAAGAVDITWTALYNNLNCFKDDVVYVMLYNETEDYYLYFADGLREDLSYSIDTSGFNSADRFHLWAFCSTRSASVASKTLYLGQFTKA